MAIIFLKTEKFNFYMKIIMKELKRQKAMLKLQLKENWHAKLCGYT